jgi:hypothetical protein
VSTEPDAPDPNAPDPNTHGARRLFRGFLWINMALLAIIAALVIRALR